jgi:hypothetical protein
MQKKIIGNPSSLAWSSNMDILRLVIKEEDPITT